MQLRNDGSAVFDHIPGDGRVLCGRDAGKGRGDDADGRHAESERRTVTGRVDAEGQAAHDHRIRHPVRQFADQPVGHLLPVRSHPARADHRKRRLAERFRGTQNIQYMRIVGGFVQQGRVLCVGGGDDLDPVFAAMFDFALCVCERFLLEDRPREFRSESGFFDEFVGRSGENRLCRTEYVEQMDRPFRAYSRREGKGYVWNFALHFPYPAIPE